MLLPARQWKLKKRGMSPPLPSTEYRNPLSITQEEQPKMETATSKLDEAKAKPEEFEEALEQLRSSSPRAGIKTQQEKANEASARRFAELAAEVGQLRLQVQTGIDTPYSSSTVSSTPIETCLRSNFIHPGTPRSEDLSFFYYKSRKHLPILSGGHSLLNHQKVPTIHQVFEFLTQLEREFKLRNYELRLPADNTDGWAKYALMQLGGAVKARATFKWGVDPNISWETFRKWVMDSFITDIAIQEIEKQYTEFHYDPTRRYTYAGGFNTVMNNVLIFNDMFRELRLLMAFLGRDTPEEMAIRDYLKKISSHNKVALALSQSAEVGEGVGGSSWLSLEELMGYCENVDKTSVV